MSKHIRIAGIAFTLAAAENIEEVGLSDADILRDRRDISSGRTCQASLLVVCLDGAADDRREGWHDYVTAIVGAADEENLLHPDDQCRHHGCARWQCDEAHEVDA